ncbi:hypothetical protein [Flagellimonas sp. HSM57]|uniref:hypothetical protein n=1 Tax=Flagellimonas sp. HSM57 TaxID=2654675 RepID=UPI0013D1828F|nr:hypothetical protein [Flagellimonas sp. HSM57]
MCLTVITYQDFKERKVFWFLFPLAMLLLGLLYYLQVTNASVFLYQILINTILVTSILSILFIYTRFITKKRFLNHSLGLGDILFFYALSLGFPTLTFIVLFVAATMFSLLVFLISKRNLKHKTVPLAGLMALFMVFVMLYDLIFKYPSLYGY